MSFQALNTVLACFLDSKSFGKKENRDCVEIVVELKISFLFYKFSTDKGEHYFNSIVLKRWCKYFDNRIRAAAIKQMVCSSPNLNSQRPLEFFVEIKILQTDQNSFKSSHRMCWRNTVCVCVGVLVWVSVRVSWDSCYDMKTVKKSVVIKKYV